MGTRKVKEVGTGRFVLENKNGEVVRTFDFQQTAYFIVYRHDTRRVEIVSTLEDLKKDKISYDLLKKGSTSSVKTRSVSLANGASFRYAKEIEKTAHTVNIKEDSEEQEKAIYKFTALTQIGIIAIIFIVGLLIEPFLLPKHEETIVTVIPQELIPKTEKLTVKATEKKVDRTKKIAKKKVVTKTKVVRKELTAKTQSRTKRNAPVRTKVNVENMGALGALGGMKSGSKNSAGFNTNAHNNSQGTSWSGAGAGGIGGMERAVHGKGLVAGAMGNGGKIEGGGGYGTRGKSGGGRPGYGSMNMGGTAASYFEPVSEESVVEGGLDRDQIAAVIARHQGEILYCYEKGLQVKSNLSGRVSIRWMINGGGRVNGASVESSSLQSAQVEGCIVNRLRGWQFPKPVGGVNVKVSYPFNLKRVGHG